jgi:hypothetical protein
VAGTWWQPLPLGQQFLPFSKAYVSSATEQRQGQAPRRFLSRCVLATPGLLPIPQSFGGPDSSPMDADVAGAPPEIRGQQLVKPFLVPVDSDRPPGRRSILRRRTRRTLTWHWGTKGAGGGGLHRRSPCRRLRRTVRFSPSQSGPVVKTRERERYRLPGSAEAARRSPSVVTLPVEAVDQLEDVAGPEDGADQERGASGPVEVHDATHGVSRLWLGGSFKATSRLQNNAFPVLVIASSLSRGQLMHPPPAAARWPEPRSSMTIS